MDARLRRIIKKIRQENLRIAFAESVTCGLIASRLGAVKGASDFFAGSVVCYSPEVKKKLLRVPASSIARYSTESTQVTKALAKNLYHVIEADVHGAVTGLATPDPDARHPKGTVFICVKHKGKFISVKKLFRGTPIEIRNKAFYAMMELIDKIISH